MIIASVAVNEHSHTQPCVFRITTESPFLQEIRTFLLNPISSAGSPYATPLQGKRFARSSAFLPHTISFSCQTSVEAATAEDVDTSVARAHAAYKSGVWSRAPLLTRSTVLSRLAQLLEERTPTMANIETLQTGRAIREMTTQIGRLPEWLWVHSFASSTVTTHPRMQTLLCRSTEDTPRIRGTDPRKIAQHCVSCSAWRRRPNHCELVNNSPPLRALIRMKRK